jgi:hypothetical protein
MAISESQRHHLHNALDEVLGPEDAAVLMSHLPPSGWSDVVRTTELDQRVAVIESRFDAVEARFDALEARVDARFHQLSNQLVTRMAALAGLVIAVDVLLSRL